MTRRFTSFDDEPAGGKFVASIVGGLSTAPIVLLFTAVPAWVLMLALGSAHDHWPIIPALGYWTTYILLAGLRVMLDPFKSVKA